MTLLLALASLLNVQFHSTDKPIATVHAASAEDVDKAVDAAKAALAHPSWKLLPASERGQLMARLADLIEQNRELLASIDAWDNGTFALAIHVLRRSGISTIPGACSSGQKPEAYAHLMIRGLQTPPFPRTQFNP